MGISINASKIHAEKLHESSRSPILSEVFQTPIGKFGKQVEETPITRLFLICVLHQIFVRRQYRCSLINLMSRSKRAAREGEMILSVNGSPLGEFSTVIKIPKENNSIVPPTPGERLHPCKLFLV